MRNNEVIRDILISFLKKEITPEQEQILNDWLDESEDNRRIFSLLTDDAFVMAELKIFQIFDGQKLQSVANPDTAEVRASVRIFRKRWLFLVTAAAVAGLVCLGFYLAEKQSRSVPVLADQKVSDVQAPVTSKAFIKDDNGHMILLDTIKPNTVFQLNGADVIKNNSGQIVYAGNSGESRMNTLFNPRGGNVIAMVLSDGTKVWLNSESSVTYPISFSDSTRNVSVKGEAYFEVAKSKTQKFIVTTAKGMTTEVLGTHFDISSYEDEDNCMVTLLEGRVQVRNNQQKVVLMPDQQAIQKANAGLLAVKQVDVNKIIGWKEGVFDFDDDDIYTISKQFSRWYDVDVKINGNFSGVTYSGVISKKLSLLQVMQVLKFAGLNYQISNNQLTITKT